MANLFESLCETNTLYDAWLFVKSKNASGGIDGMSIPDFEANHEEFISELANDLKSGKWIPQPYKGITIPKNNTERRKIGLLSIKDKVVQTSIKLLIEPMFEKIFVNNSYGYRPGKGHYKAVRRTLFECHKPTRSWFVKLDIDDYFDTIDHEQLFNAIATFIDDNDIVRLIMLSMKMGRVSAKMKWQDIKAGVPQGAVLSPILSNFYLHTFDKFITGITDGYVRYADDFVILCDTKEEAHAILEQASRFLSEKLSLKLNQPVIGEISKGFDFLGVCISKKGVGLSEKKKRNMKEKINSFSFTVDGLSPDSLKTWEAYHVYYKALLSQNLLSDIDYLLNVRLKNIIKSNHSDFPNQTVLKKALQSINYLSEVYELNKKSGIKELIELYKSEKSDGSLKDSEQLNEKIISARKREYKKRENENRELVVSTNGSFLGLSKKGVTVKVNGKVIYQKPAGALSHIIISGHGITISSHLIDYCLFNKISIDFFNPYGGHTGSILSNRYIESTHWNQQACCGNIKRRTLAKLIIHGKLKNQLYLVKYFHKYHKTVNPALQETFDNLKLFFDSFTSFFKTKNVEDEDFLTLLVSFEAQGAVRYWEYIRQLLYDDKIDFRNREHKGATDLVNCMLNYGYALLYSRVWQALLKAKLNPFDSIIHVRQTGKPTFVYDVVEIFRAQVVDRVVISLIQKGNKLNVKNGLLDDETKKLLAKSVLERLNRTEQYRGEEISMEQIIGKQTNEIAAFILDESSSYKPYTAKW